MECGNMAGCVGLNHNAATGGCEVLDAIDLTTLAADSDWNSYRIQDQPKAHTLDPCSSNPCDAGKVCVRYTTLARVPLNPQRSLDYSVPGYACSAHQWLLDLTNQGKTDCFFVELQNKDFPQYDLHIGDMYFYEAFEAFTTYDALTLECRFAANEKDHCWLKSNTPLVVSGNLFDVSPYIYWYPNCQ